MKKVFFLSIICLMALTILSGCTEGEYVDLGLPSGTKWKTTNETNPNDTCDFFTYDEAMEKFGNQLPTSKQWMELKKECDWAWDDTKKGYMASGPNGNSIFLPAAGFGNHYGKAGGTGIGGYYWSSTPSVSGYAWSLDIYGGEIMSICDDKRCEEYSVRLVKGQD